MVSDLDEWSVRHGDRFDWGATFIWNFPEGSEVYRGWTMVPVEAPLHLMMDYSLVVNFVRINTTGLWTKNRGHFWFELEEDAVVVAAFMSNIRD